MSVVRILIADDHPMIIEGLRLFLERHSIQVTDKAADADSVLATFDIDRHDVLVLDINFGGGPSGIDVARQLLNRYPQAAIVMYSQHDQIEMIRQAYKLGVRCFVPKSAPPSTLAEAIKEAHAGKIHFLPEVASRLALLALKGTDSPLYQLDEREMEVFRQMAAGRTNNEIAENLNLSTKTISTTSQAIKDKLGVQRAAEITLLAVKYQIITI